MIHHNIVANGNDGANVGGMGAIDNILLSEQVCGRNHCGTNLVQGGDCPPELVAALHDEHHHVAALDAELCEERGCLVALALHVGKSELVHLATVVGP